MKKKWLVVGILVFAVMCLTLNRSMAQDEVKIGYLTIVMSLPTFVALEKGFFQEQGLKVVNTPFESGTLIVDALVAGRIDVNAGSSIVGLWMVEQNLPGAFKIFTIYHAAEKDVTVVLMVAKDSPLKEMKDLKGKRIGTFPGITSLSLAKAVSKALFRSE